MATSSKHRGWKFDAANSRLLALFNGTSVFQFTASALSLLQNVTVASGKTLTMTSGNVVLTAGDVTATAGNVVLGSPGAFATTQGVAMVKMGGSSLGGTAPVGAITTAGGIFASDTVVRKIIADGTASNVET